MKTILITGSSSGIGRYTAHEFSKNGYELILTYCKDKKGGEKTREECVRFGALKVNLFALDLRKNEEIMALNRVCRKSFPRIDFLVNNAAIICWKPLKNQNHEEIENQIRINLEGTIKLTKALLPFIQKIVINVGSKMSKKVRSDLPVYCASKFGLRGFSQALALDRPDLFVYCVNPDLTATKMTGFVGRDPAEVAKIIFRVSQQCTIVSGSDIDVWEESVKQME